jgi:hypothetical protein
MGLLMKGGFRGFLVISTSDKSSPSLDLPDFVIKKLASKIIFIFP